MSNMNDTIIHLIYIQIKRISRMISSCFLFLILRFLNDRSKFCFFFNIQGIRHTKKKIKQKIYKIYLFLKKIVETNIFFKNE